MIFSLLECMQHMNIHILFVHCILFFTTHYTKSSNLILFNLRARYIYCPAAEELHSHGGETQLRVYWECFDLFLHSWWRTSMKCVDIFNIGITITTPKLYSINPHRFQNLNVYQYLVKDRNFEVSSYQPRM